MQGSNDRIAVDSSYRVSESGRSALASDDRSIPSDYRTVLWVIEFEGADHLPRLMKMFPEQMLADCLAEMEELGLVERAAAATDGSADAAKAIPPPPAICAVTPEDLQAASGSLARQGAYLAEERLKQRRPKQKAPSETTILIVEDDPDQLALADLRISIAGYRVRVADSQAAMLRSMAHHGTPDLILLDATLPDGNGFDILARMRALPSFKSLPIVMLTAKSAQSDIVKGLAAGADGYITKPYSKNILASAIKRILQAA